MNTRSMTRKRQEAILSTIRNTFEELRSHHTISSLPQIVATSSNIAPSSPPPSHKYRLRPRKIVSYFESDEFTYNDDAKDPDYIPYIHNRSISNIQSHPPSILPNASTPTSLRTNISSFITEVNASFIGEDGLYSQIGQSNAGVSHRWALRSIVKK